MAFLLASSASPIVLVVVLVLDLFARERYHPVGSIDYGLFDHKAAYQRPRTRTTTRTIRGAEEYPGEPGHWQGVGHFQTYEDAPVRPACGLTSRRLLPRQRLVSIRGQLHVPTAQEAFFAVSVD